MNDWRFIIIILGLFVIGEAFVIVNLEQNLDKYIAGEVKLCTIKIKDVNNFESYATGECVE